MQTIAVRLPPQPKNPPRCNRRSIASTVRRCGARAQTGARWPVTEAAGSASRRVAARSKPADFGSVDQRQPVHTREHQPERSGGCNQAGDRGADRIFDDPHGLLGKGLGTGITLR